jgi:hypothetical protein
VTALEHELDEAERELEDEQPAPAPILNRAVRRQLDKDARATSAREWKREEPELHELPTANIALLQRPQIMEAMRQGKIPNTLLGAALSSSQGGGVQDFEEAAEFLAYLVASAFVEPQVSVEDEPPEGVLHISAIADLDRKYVLEWVRGEVAALDSFRGDGPGADAGGDGGDVRDEAE